MNSSPAVPMLEAYPTETVRTGVLSFGPPVRRKEA